MPYKLRSAALVIALILFPACSDDRGDSGDEPVPACKPTDPGCPVKPPAPDSKTPEVKAAPTKPEAKKPEPPVAPVK